MTAEERAALVERVAMAIEQADNERTPDGFYKGNNREVSDWGAFLATAAIDLIRGETLEEAARVADSHAVSPDPVGVIKAMAIAAAIRTRKEKP